MDNNKANHNDVLFNHDRICCVCRDINKKYIQIHHIDGNHENNNTDNLAVLCQDCHTETQITGGFFKKLNPELVKKYRDEWIEIVKHNKLQLKNTEGIRIKLKHPLENFLNQFYINNILPINQTFYFYDYYIKQPGFLTLVVISDGLTESNSRYLTSLFKSYIFCILGELAPYDFLVTNTYSLSQSLKKIMLSKDIQISVPNWMIKGLEHLFYIQIKSNSYVKQKEILLTFSPLFYKFEQNYSELTSKFEELVLNLKGHIIEI